MLVISVQKKYVQFLFESVRSDLFCFIIQSFFNDDAQKQLFEQVLTNLGISAEEKLYVRELVNTDGGLEKLLSSKYYIYVYTFYSSREKSS